MREAGEGGGGVKEEEEDPVVREMSVFLCSDAAGSSLALLSHPLRPPWRPYEYGKVKSLRMKPAARRLEVDLPLDTASSNYSAREGCTTEGGSATASSSVGMDKVTLRSSPVESKTSLAVGYIHEGSLLLAPLDYSVQMRPHLSHLSTVRKPGRCLRGVAAHACACSHGRIACAGSCVFVCT